MWVIRRLDGNYIHAELNSGGCEGDVLAFKPGAHCGVSNGSENDAVQQPSDRAAVV
jgi:hypothetical protein